MSKRKLKWEDLERNPQLQLNGLKAGDEIADDTGGSAPPPDKTRGDIEPPITGEPEIENNGKPETSGSNLEAGTPGGNER